MIVSYDVIIVMFAIAYWLTVSSKVVR